MTSAKNAARLRDHLAAERRHDMEAALATLHPDCHFVDQPLAHRRQVRSSPCARS
jgi:hypothetical protein